MPHRIAVVGPGDVPTDSREYEAAEALGRLLAHHGVTVLCGGRAGVMEAVARGVGESGVVVGVLPDPDDRRASPYLTVALPTGLGESRNAVLVAGAHAVISVGGSWGTLSEIALAVRIGRPVVSLWGWRVVDAAGSELVAVHYVEDVNAAVQVALDILRQQP